jgi:aryl-alcohol dehydrogenase-like predicted oxidoreductase
MQHRRIGEVQVSAIGLGGMPMSIEGRPDEERSVRTIHAALDAGITLIDTADAYHIGADEVGHNETLIARALASYGGDTSSVLVATKGGHLRPGDGSWTKNGSPDYLKQACEESLKRLGVETIGLYQFHRPDPKVPIEESIGALDELKADGKIRHIGVSNFSEDQYHAAERVTPIVSVQNRYNAADRSSESMVDLCEQEQLVFLPWAPIRDTERDTAVTDAARQHGASLQQIVLAWLLARSPQMLPIPGSGSPEHVAQNIAAASIELSPDEITAIGKGG